MTRNGIEARQGRDVKQARSRRDESPVAEGDAPNALGNNPPNPTLEMIEAGMDAFYASQDGVQASDLLLEDCIRSIYLAMRAADQPPPHTGPRTDIDKAVDGLVKLHRRLLSCFQSPTGEPPPRRPEWFEPTMADCDAALDAAVTLERIKAVPPHADTDLTDVELVSAADVARKVAASFLDPEIAGDTIRLLAAGKMDDHLWVRLCRAAIAEHEVLHRPRY